MSDYIAPVKDMRFVMDEIVGLDAIAALPGYEEATPDMADAILEEAAKFASGVLAPLNWIGDTQGCKLGPDGVVTADGWKEAYKAFCDAGWNGLASPTAYGGQGLPEAIGIAVKEMASSANLSFSLGPLLTGGAVAALLTCASDELKAIYLEKMISGEWTGTMNLTEPNAGSDLALIRSRAEPQADGSYRVFGQKIFITYGDHDMTDNIVHLVLARLPDAPAGVKGISLFLVPKFLVNADGSLGERNDAYCVSIEHKLGIHASPTCVMAFGDKGGAVGYLLGEANRGLEYMFIMMNEARMGVGLGGLALSERSYQHALQYAKDRIQGTDAGVRGGPKVNILHHADVRRLLMNMKSKTEAMRALAYVVGAAFDKAHHHADEAVRAQNQAFVDLMIPVVKGWCTENSIDVTSDGVQVHGGMGFIEETGAAQHFRDSRITTIYEGTTAIQANDLIGRKIARENGATVGAVVKMMRAVEAEVAGVQDEAFAAIARALGKGIAAVEEAVAYILATYSKDIKAASVGSVPFLKLLGIVAGGWQMARAALVAKRKLEAGEGDTGFCKAKIVTARFYADHVLAQAGGLAYTVVNGAPGALELTEELF